MSFIISPIEERHLKIAPDCFVEQLKETWPSTETHDISNQTRPFILEWQLSCKEHPLPKACHLSPTAPQQLAAKSSPLSR